MLVATLIAAALLFLPIPALAVTFTDWWTSALTKIALLAEPSVEGAEVSAIAVEAHGDLVTLRGRVATEHAQAAASAVALRIPGVRTVNNELRVDDDTAPAATRPDDRELRARVMRAFHRDARLARSSFSVTVDEGVVHLAGAVPIVWDRVRASEVAHDVPGVVAVQNDAAPISA